MVLQHPVRLQCAVGGTGSVITDITSTALESLGIGRYQPPRQLLLHFPTYSVLLHALLYLLHLCSRASLQSCPYATLAHPRASVAPGIRPPATLAHPCASSQQMDAKPLVKPTDSNDTPARQRMVDRGGFDISTGD
jgi:hypothetical protein